MHHQWHNLNDSPHAHTENDWLGLNRAELSLTQALVKAEIKQHNACKQQSWRRVLFETHLGQVLQDKNAVYVTAMLSISATLAAASGPFVLNENPRLPGLLLQRF